jgi:hypothetical protein
VPDSLVDPGFQLIPLDLCPVSGSRLNSCVPCMYMCVHQYGDRGDYSITDKGDHYDNTKDSKYSSPDTTPQTCLRPETWSVDKGQSGIGTEHRRGPVWLEMFGSPRWRRSRHPVTPRSYQGKSSRSDQSTGPSKRSTSTRYGLVITTCIEGMFRRDVMHPGRRRTL